MLTGALRKKRIMQLMVLIYMLLSMGTANAAFWCHTGENSSHLKVNPIGKCWVNDSPDSELLQQCPKAPRSTDLHSSPGDDCLDSPVLSSALPASKLPEILDRNPATSCDTTYLSHTSALNSEVKGLVNHSPPVYLPESQRLQVQRTVVLLR